MNRKPLFDALRPMLGGALTTEQVRMIDAAIDRGLGIRPAGFRLSREGEKLIHSFEQCRLEAYPDPGSRDGHPWTIGWGATGPGIVKGTVWTQEQADERFRRDIVARESQLNNMLAGSATTQNQFDALLSLGYNIGMVALQGSTVMRRHKAGDFAGAADAFGMWVKNDGKVMRGLVRRREAEAKMYRGEA
jgi:GH24 family phage-related lysozyme (muramidase)